MRPLVPLAVVYLLVAALLMPGSPLAAEEQQPEATPTTTEAAPTTTAPAEAPAAPTTTEAAPPPAPPPATEPPPAPAPPPAEPAQAEPAEPAESPPAERTAAKRAGAPKATARRKRRSAKARAAATGRVTIQDFAYAPATISVDVGDSVTWTNRDSADHTATGGDFDTGVLSGGQSGSFTFRNAGTFSYVCTIHPNMKGSVRVAAAAEEQAPETEGSGAQESEEGEEGTGAAPAPSSGGPSLPRSGADEGWLAGLGALLLLAGFAARRRANAG